MLFVDFYEYGRNEDDCFAAEGDSVPGKRATMDRALSFEWRRKREEVAETTGANECDEGDRQGQGKVKGGMYQECEAGGLLRSSAAK